MEKKSYCSRKQKELLVELLKLKENEDLISGKFNQKFSYKDSENKWQKIAATVNAVPGSQKDWKHWKKIWQDIRSKTKKRKAHNQQICGTGGGQKVVDITDTDEQILELIHPQLISENKDIEENKIVFDYVDPNEMKKEKINIVKMQLNLQ
ncbi:unnamed protein product [Psylliodes chrysocephalus]|uniref:Regulatory protein zeste n=1 Tax=Psylliodes chrysocephalus TaxID=3402493 RepID=A0A9P0CMU4_9CUCU|nr:unnamed protein product [Psylliodes chrysocephala]